MDGRQPAARSSLVVAPKEERLLDPSISTLLVAVRAGRAI